METEAGWNERLEREQWERRQTGAQNGSSGSGGAGAVRLDYIKKMQHWNSECV